jgi:hypothetical protein
LLSENKEKFKGRQKEMGQVTAEGDNCSSVRLVSIIF